MLTMSYEPKVDAVRDGKCRQTLRPVASKGKHPVVRRVADFALSYAWSGTPYCSTWKWQRKDTIVELVRMDCSLDSIFMYWYSQARDIMHPIGKFYEWDSPVIDDLARRDYIQEKNGLSLRRVIDDIYGLANHRILTMEAIRW